MNEIANKDVGSALEAAKNNTLINTLEQNLVDHFPAVDCPVVHRFTPGMYSREIFMPAGTVVTSKIHKTEHQYVVLSGTCRVYIENEGFVELSEGHVGITKPGTRRVLFMLTNVRWVTFHPTELTDLEEIEKALIEPHNFPKHRQLGEYP